MGLFFATLAPDFWLPHVLLPETFVLFAEYRPSKTTSMLFSFDQFFERIRRGSLLTLLFSLLAIGQAQEATSILSKLQADVYFGPNASIAFGGEAGDIRNRMANFRDQNFATESDFPYTAEGTVTGTAGMLPVIGVHFGANVGYALNERLLVKAGLSARQAGYRWYTEQTYADNELQYDQELFYQERHTTTLVEVPVQLELQTANGGALFVGLGLGSASTAKQVVRDNDLVWINNRRSDILSSESRVVTDFENREDVFGSVMLGGSLPLSEQLHLRIEGHLTTPTLRTLVGNTSVSFCLGYRLAGDRFAD